MNNKKVKDYHCSLEGFHMSSTQQQAVSDGCVKDLANKQQLTHLCMAFEKNQLNTNLSLCLLLGLNYINFTKSLLF